MYFKTFLLRALCATLFLSTQATFAQMITVKGKVTDQHSGKVIPGVSVKIGSYSTSSDLEGTYVMLVQKATAVQQGLLFTSVGYKPLKTPFTPGEINGSLVPITNQLNEVVIASPRESIVERAIRKIPENYRFDPFILQGKLQIINSAKYDSIDTYYYRSESALKLHYSKKPTPDIALLKIKDTLIVDPKHKLALRWVGGYTNVGYKDYVRKKPEFLTSGTKKYNYVLNGKEWINNHRSYVVNFFSSQQTGSAGTLYIDTATYAFVRITYTAYHIKVAFSIDVDKSTNIINYEQQNNKWYLNSTETSSLANYDGFNLFRSYNFKRDAIETANVQPIPYTDRLPVFTEDLKIARAADSSALATNGNRMINSLPANSVPNIDTSLPEKTTWLGRLNLLERVRTYVIGDNIRQGYGLANLPIRLHTEQPVLGKKFNQLNNYAFYTFGQYRLIPKKQLFLQYEHLFNFGITPLRNSGEAFGLAYYVKLNNTGHPWTLTPSIGVASLNIKEKKTFHYSQKSVYYGLNVTYELSPRWGYFVAGKYDDPYKQKMTTLSVEHHPLSISTGFLFKLKI